MVAKTYQTLRKASEPYEKNKKMYIDVETKKGTIKSVRWYTVDEYNKMYPEAPIKTYKNMKHALGFNNGYITIFKGATKDDEDWFKKSLCRFAKFWGWYVVSTDEVPADKPKHLIPYRLRWEDVSTSNEQLKPTEEIKAFISAALASQ